MLPRRVTKAIEASPRESRLSTCPCLQVSYTEQPYSRLRVSERARARERERERERLLLQVAINRYAPAKLRGARESAAHLLDGIDSFK